MYITPTIIPIYKYCKYKIIKNKNNTLYNDDNNNNLVIIDNNKLCQLANMPMADLNQLGLSIKEKEKLCNKKIFIIDKNMKSLFMKKYYENVFRIKKVINRFIFVINQFMNNVKKDFVAFYYELLIGE